MHDFEFWENTAAKFIGVYFPSVPRASMCVKLPDVVGQGTNVIPQQNLLNTHNPYWFQGFSLPKLYPPQSKQTTNNPQFESCHPPRIIMEDRLRAHAREMETLGAMGAAYDRSQTRKRWETGHYALLPSLSLSLHLPPTKRLCARNCRSKTKLLFHDMTWTPMRGIVFESSPPNLEDSAPPQVVDSHESPATKDPNHSSELITQVVDPHGSSTPSSSRSQQAQKWWTHTSPPSV